MLYFDGRMYFYKSKGNPNNSLSIQLHPLSKLLPLVLIRVLFYSTEFNWFFQNSLNNFLLEYFNLNYHKSLRTLAPPTSVHFGFSSSSSKWAELELIGFHENLFIVLC
jgi:hypothetical protein